MFRLKCAFQVYDWGKVGVNSEVYKLLSQNQELDNLKPYAEVIHVVLIQISTQLWMGTHVSGPSFMMDSPSISLDAYISRNPHCLGSKVSEKFGNALPFLFKVLSVRKALSIQAHPDKVSSYTLIRQWLILFLVRLRLYWCFHVKQLWFSIHLNKKTRKAMVQISKYY